MNKFETVATDVLHGIEEPFKFVDKAVKVLDTAIQDQPELKTLLTQAVQKAQAIGTDALAAGGDKGLNLVADQQVLTDAEAFFKWFMASVVPVIESVYEDVKTDIEAPATTS